MPDAIIRQLHFSLERGALFLDFDGTISRGRFWNNLKDRVLAREIERIVFKERRFELDEWMRGTLSSEELHASLARLLGRDATELWRRFESHAKRIRVYNLDLVAKLRPFLKIALVTTNVDVFTRYTIRSKKLDSYFDIVVNSADWRMLKSEPGGGIFKHAARMVGCQIHDCVLIDDSVKVCSIFASLGGKAIPTIGVRHTGDILRALLLQFTAEWDEKTPSKMTMSPTENAYRSKR